MLLSQVIPSLLLKLSYRTVMFIVSVRFSINMPCTSYCYREVAHYSCKISKVSIFNHIMQFTKSSGQNNLCTHRTALFIIMKPSVKLDDCLLLQSWSVQVKMELLMVKAVCGGICGRKVHCPTQGLTYLSWWPLLISSSPTSSSRIPPSGTFILFIAGEHNNSVCFHQ